MKRFSSRAELLISLALGGVLLHGLVRLAEKAWAYLHSPYSRDYGEGCVLMMVQLLDQRGSYFVGLRDYPFVHGNYPPLFIALVWPFYSTFGPSLWAPRLLSTTATAVLALVLYFFFTRLSGSRRHGLAFAGLAVSVWFVQTWAPMGRVDMLAFLLSTSGLLAFLAGRSWLVVFPLFWLAFFTKQNALLAPAAVVLHVFLEGDFRRSARAALGFALPLGAIFAALNLATAGGLFRHLITYTAAAEYEWNRMWGEYVAFGWNAWPLLVLIAAALPASPRAFTTGPGRLIFIYWLLNMAALSTIAKAGAAQNYLIEPWLATVSLAAIALPVVAARAPTPREWAMGALLVAATVAAYTGHDSFGLPPYFDQDQAAAHRLPQAISHPERAADFRRLWEVIRSTEGPILSENVAALVVNGKPVLVEPHGIMLLAKTGYFDPEPLARDCEAGRFKLVVAERRFEETPKLGECLERRYRPAETLGPYRLLRPLPRE